MIHFYINLLNENIISQKSWRQVQRVIDKKGHELYKKALKQNNKSSIKVKLIFFVFKMTRLYFSLLFYSSDSSHFLRCC